MALSVLSKVKITPVVISNPVIANFRGAQIVNYMKTDWSD